LRWARLAVPAAVAVVAFLARLVPVLRGGGLFSLVSYDGAVYYTAASGLAHGLLPYRDFLLLHPPGIVLALLPFAEVGRLIGDGNALAVAEVAWMALGAVNAVLVTRILRDRGLVPAAIGGLAYAVFFPAAYLDHYTSLETPATTCLLLAVLLLVRTPPGSRIRPRAALAIGAFVGAGAAFKIWGVVLAAAVLLWCLATSGWRQALVAAGGVGLGAAAICLPFFAFAPGTMWRMVVLDQIDRLAADYRIRIRLRDLVGLSALGVPIGWVPIVVAVTALIVVAIFAWWSSRIGRLGVVLAAATCGLLLATPSWFVHYAGILGGPFAIMLGAAADALGRLLVRRRRQFAGAAAAVAVLVGYGLANQTTTLGEPFPAAALAVAAVGIPGCMTTDDPTALIETGWLQRNFARHCRLVADLGGYSYDHIPPSHMRREEDIAWQRLILGYLRSGGGSVLIRFSSGVGLSKQTAETVKNWPIIVRAGRFTLRRPLPDPAAPGG
jgi:alpha-1,2-mannosyltransferase